MFSPVHQTRILTLLHRGRDYILSCYQSSARFCPSFLTLGAIYPVQWISPRGTPGSYVYNNYIRWTYVEIKGGIDFMLALWPRVSCAICD